MDLTRRRCEQLGETVYECKDKTNNAFFARDTDANLQSLVHLSHAQMCTMGSSVATGQRDRKEEHNNWSCDHVLEKARVSTSHLLILSQQRLWENKG